MIAAARQGAVPLLGCHSHFVASLAVVALEAERAQDARQVLAPVAVRAHERAAVDVLNARRARGREAEHALEDTLAADLGPALMPCS
jgi:hypothetical protein